ncbi:Nudix hydrolase 8, partial [Cucurbita argyrosperma subsp. sororia]
MRLCLIWPSNFSARCRHVVLGFFKGNNNALSFDKKVDKFPELAKRGKKGYGSSYIQSRMNLFSWLLMRGFNYHHAEAGYAMLTFWIPDLFSMLSSDSSHHFGVAAFLINDNKEALPPCGLLRTRICY